MVQCCNKFFDFSVCRSPIFIVLVLTVMFMAIGMPHSLFFMPAYAVSIGLSSGDASMLLSLSAVCDLVGRLTFGVIIDLDIVPSHVWYSFMIFLSGITTLLIPTATTFNQILIYLALYGIGSGVWFLMVPLLLAEYLGVEKIGSSYGMVRLFQAVTNVMGPIVAGYLYGTLGQLDYSFFFMGTCMVTGGIFSLLLPFTLKAKESNVK